MATTTSSPTYPEDGSFDWYWHAGNVFFSIGVIVGSIITIIHTKNVFIDLFTTDRASIPSKHKPKKSTTYKFTAWCLLVCLYAFLYNMIWSGISNVITTNDHSSFCYMMTLNATNSYQLAKMFMYLVFIIRLYAVYDTTEYRFISLLVLLYTHRIMYRYNPKILLTLCILIVSVSLVLMTLITLNAETTHETHADEEKDRNFDHFLIPLTPFT